ncbi:MAG: hypothetical protein ACKN9C_10880 [Fluviibacter sp.]
MPQDKESSHWRFGSEIRSVLHLTVYFGVWFSALNLLMHEIEGRAGLPLEAWGFAWIKAAICAKFLLIGQLLVPMPKVTQARVWSVILPRSIVYLAIVVGLSFLEEGVRGAMHGEAFLHALGGFGGGNPLRIFALAWVYWLMLVPYLVIVGLLARPAVGE